MQKINIEDNLLYKEDVYKIIGAAYEVYNELGNGFLEAVYQEALEIEFDLRKIPYISQKEINIKYKGRQLKQKYKPDYLVDNKIIVEIKGIPKLTNNEVTQIINYLKATGIKVGLLINFGNNKNLEWKRIIF
ncbi:MAG TPA: GxxExxY protein [bacterium]|nr:GxxExxY protein [bacterium]HPQ20074.1 GxxExxY protein [bacterium]